MKISKRLLSALLMATMLVLLLSGCTPKTEEVSGKTEEVIVLRFGHTLSTEHSLQKAAEFLGRRLDELSDGKLKLEIYSGGVLGGEKAQLESLMSGGHDFHMGTQAPLAGWLPQFQILDLPYLIRSVEEADSLLSGDFGQKLLQILPEKNLYGLGWGENGFREFTNSKLPLVKPEDIRGQKIRVMENPVMIDTLKLWGADPTPMSVTELYTALQTGTVDGEENPTSLIYSQKFQEVQDYLTISNHFYSPFILYASKKNIDALPKELQDIVFQAGKETCDFQRELAREQNNEATTKLEEEGMKVNHLSIEEMAIWKEAAIEVYDKYRSVIGESLFDEAMEAIQKIQAE